MNPPQLNVTIKWIDECITRAARFASTRIAGQEFRAVLDLAMRDEAFSSSGLDHLLEIADQDEVQLDGNELRILLILARRSKRRQLGLRSRALRGR